MNRHYPETSFGGFTDVDGTVIFFSRVNAMLRPTDVVLDVGCGRGAYTTDSVPYRRNLRVLRGKVAKVIGIDVDPAGESNEAVDEFRLIDSSTWPVESDSVDVVLADWVLEHIADVPQFLGECRRVLRNGGLLCARTSNVMSYVGMLSRVIPNNLHSRALTVAQPERKAQDVFETTYKANTVRRLRSALKKAGFESVVYGYDSEPQYLAFSRIAYRIGVFHQRHAPSIIKPSLFAFARKV